MMLHKGAIVAQAIYIRFLGFFNSKLNANASSHFVHIVVAAPRDGRSRHNG